jgi:hypothetical protein
MTSVTQWRWYSVDGPEPDWLYDVRDALGGLSDALTWVDRVQIAWELERPLPTTVTSRLLGPSRDLWLFEPPLAAVRDRLTTLGFEVDGDPPPLRLPDGTPDEEIKAFGESLAKGGPYPIWRGVAPEKPRPPGIEPPYPIRHFDAYEPKRGIAVIVEWEHQSWRQFEAREMSLLDTDLHFLVLARRLCPGRTASSFERSERVLARLFDATDTAGSTLQQALVHGVLLIGI